MKPEIQNRGAHLTSQVAAIYLIVPLAHLKDKMQICLRAERLLLWIQLFLNKVLKILLSIANKSWCVPCPQFCCKHITIILKFDDKKMMQVRMLMGMTMMLMIMMAIVLGGLLAPLGQHVSRLLFSNLTATATSTKHWNCWKFYLVVDAANSTISSQYYCYQFWRFSNHTWYRSRQLLI